MKAGNLIALACLSLGLFACGAAASSEAVVQVTSVEAAAPTPEPSPTTETAPSSLLENKEVLEKMGYTIQQGDRGWELISPQGQTVLVSSDTLTIQAFGANNELLISPEQAFDVETTIGAGMEQLLVLKNTEGQVTHTFLERAGYWAPLAETQRDPREIENYPFVPMDSLWNGLLAQSEALTAEPFPEGTLVPDKFVYYLWFSSQGYLIQLQDVVNGLEDLDYRYAELVNKDNDYRRYTNFYRSQTPDGIDVIIATEQILMPDGKTTLHLHHIVGGERPWTEPVLSGGNRTDLRQNIFLGREEPAPDGTLSMAVRPVVFSSRYENEEPWGISFTREPNAGISMYDLDQNNPTNAKEGLEDYLRNQYDNFDRRIPRGPVGDVGDEILEWQYMGLTSNAMLGIIKEEYFNTQRSSLP